MAMIPDINLGNRGIDQMPGLRATTTYRGGGKFIGETRRELDHTGSLVAHRLMQISDVIDRKRQRDEYEKEKAERKAEIAQEKARREAEHAAAVQDRADSREAEFALGQMVDIVKNGWNGTDVQGQDGKIQHIPGACEKTYADWKAENKDPSQAMSELMRSAKESDAYKNLTPTQKAKLERAWGFKVNEFARTAHEQSVKLSQHHAVEQTQANIAWRGKMVADKFGSNDEDFKATARWAAIRNFVDLQGTAITNADDFANPNATFEDIKWRNGVTEEEKQRKFDQYNRMLASYDVGRARTLLQAASDGKGLPGMSPRVCIVKAKQIIDSASGVSYTQKGEAVRTGKNWLAGVDKDGNPIDGSVGLNDMVVQAQEAFARVNDVNHKRNAAAVAKDFERFVQDFDDTEKLRDSKEINQVEYNAKLDAMVANDDITPEVANAQKQMYAELIQHRDKLNKAIKEGKGEWVEMIRVRDQKKIKTFVPFQEGGEKTPNEFKRTFAELGSTMPGEKSVWDNPSAAMDQLGMLYKLGRIDYKFYEEKIKYGRMLSNDKAKMYYLEHFGSKGIEGMLTEAEKKTWKGKSKDLYAKNAGWRGNHKSAAEFLADAMTSGWGQDEVELSPDQRGKCYDIICDCTAAGIDPTAALREILAPTMKAYADKDLDFRLDKKNGIVDAIIAQGQTSFFGGVDSEPLHPRDPKTKEEELKASMRAPKKAE